MSHLAIPLIVVTLVMLFYILFLRPKRERLTERTVISDKDYLAQLQAEARGMRCPHPSYAGTKATCGRAAGRPCVPGCTGRTDLTISWRG